MGERQRARYEERVLGFHISSQYTIFPEAH